MGFSVNGNGWKETFNWKPTSSANKTGGFKDSPLVNDFMATFKTAAGNSLNGTNIKSSGFNADKTEAGVRLNDLAGSFTGSSASVIYNIFGGKLADTINGNAKGDFIQGHGGNDKINGMGGNDELWGGGGSDTINGGEGRDVLCGNDGNDTLSGEAGNDLLLGDKGDDKLFGGKGNDYIFGGVGNDTLTGGEGADRFYLSRNSGSGTVITDFTNKMDSIWIIGERGTKNKYEVEADTKNPKNVLIKDENGKILATVLNAKESEVEKRLSVGPSMFKDYADTSAKKPR